MTIMPTDQETKAVRKSLERAFKEMDDELEKCKNLNEAMSHLLDVVKSLRRSRDPVMDHLLHRLFADIGALVDLQGVEIRKLRGKQEAEKKVVDGFGNLSPTDARTVIDDLIKKEKQAALKHAQKGLELLRGSTMPESIPEAAKELAEAAKELQGIAGKEIVKGFF